MINSEIKPCLGIRGKLFGHKYKTVYIKKANPPSADEANKLVKMLSNQLTPLVHTNSGEVATFSASQRQSEIRRYNYAVQDIVNGVDRGDHLVAYELCIRCGDKINPNE